jgi:hypothetical protein
MPGAPDEKQVRQAVSLFSKRFVVSGRFSTARMNQIINNL